MSRPVSASRPAAPDRNCAGWQDGLALLGLGLLAAWLVARTWRKWPDPLMDFGYQLYTPWRLASGAVLYRDIDHPYGPLSQYAHALLFHLAGPGLLTLVIANLVVYALILAALYYNLRTGWGRLAAVGAGAVFVMVFSFSQLDGIGNYTYAAPYTHEVTHGLFACLVLAAVLPRWLERRSPGLALAAGLLTGLTVVLKPEFMAAAGLMLATAFVLGRSNGRRFGASEWGCLAIGAVFPLLAFTAWLARDLPLAEAWNGANRAWTFVFTSHQVEAPLQQAFLGLDHPLANAGRQLVATLKAAAVLGGIGGLLWAAERQSSPAVRWSFMAAAGGLALAAGGIADLLYDCAVPGGGGLSLWLKGLTDWVYAAGRCLPGLALLGAGGIAVDLRRARRDGAGVDRALATRAVLAALGLALLVRMALNARVYQFGFYQAAIATVVVCSILLAEPPRRLRLAPELRRMWVAACLLLLGAGAAKITLVSQSIFSLKVFPVGEGRDRFFAFAPSFNPTGRLVEAVAGRMRASSPDQILLMLPEGVMVNYLSRRASPIPTANFFPIDLGHGREEKIVAALERHPPDFVGLISRDLREYAIDHFGEETGSGRLILGWVGRHYHQVWGAGGNPLDPDHYGVVLFQRSGPPR
jgi:hypothetical protein